MVQSRARRVRKVVALSSDDEDDATHNATDDAANASTTKVSSLGRTRSHAGQNNDVEQYDALVTRPIPDVYDVPASQATTASPTPTPKSTPKKKGTKAEARNGKGAKAKTIYSFFNSATQKLQQHSQSPERFEVVEPADTIQDDISDKERYVPKLQRRSAPCIVNPKKRSVDAYVSETVNALADPARLPSQKFLKAADGTRLSSITVQIQEPPIVDPRPWAEKYGPTNVEELVMHKKKVADLRQWMTAALAGQPYKGVLVLKGAAGSGKTTTFLALANALDVEIVEWRNPSGSDYEADGYVSMSAQFDDFLSRGRKFASLDFADADGVDIHVEEKKEQAPSVHGRQIILIEEFPSTLLRMNTALQSFRSTLLQNLATTARPAVTEPTTPIVLIISESMSSYSGGPSESFTAHRLLGPEVLHHPGCSTVEFNAVAPTFIAKALSLAIQKHRKVTGDQFSPDPDVLRRISSIGDVRNAVSALEFICRQGGSEVAITTSSLKESRARSAKSKSQPPTKVHSTASSLSLIGLRGSTLGLFHAVGKVVYNKRSSPGSVDAASTTITSTAEWQLPVHLSHHARVLPSEIELSTLIDETGTDTSTFLSALHENYALSCAQPNDTESTLDTLNNCLDALGDADLLLGSAFATRAGVAEGLRQEELAFETGVRGILFNLPYPVKRELPPGKGKADAHRMFYPTSLKIWKRREEILGLVDFFVIKAMQGDLLVGMESSRNKTGGKRSISQPGRMISALSRGAERGVETWQRSRNFGRPTDESGDETATPTLSLGSGQSARHEMLLERLPYLVRILPRKEPQSISSFASGGLSKQIEQVTSFSGVGIMQDDDEEDEPAEIGVTVKPIQIPGNSHLTSGGIEEVDVEGLVLSDDDIEDD